MNEVDFEKLQREEIRWRILQVLNAGRPMSVSETITLRALQDVSLPVTPHGLRKELTYLEDRKLIELSNTKTPTWSADLTRLGVDIVEYTLDCDPGIARPKKWF